jgi:hypothetical protein
MKDDMQKKVTILIQTGLNLGKQNGKMTDKKSTLHTF